ncbi:MAG: GIY-YIG nuclease family protein [Cyclobacteriaceae bacterium]
MNKGGYIYIVSNKSRSVYYVGVTADLRVRSHEHKSLNGSVFTKKYQCTDLIYYEFFETIEAAIKREKQLKKWKRAWKDELVRKLNPEMKNLYNEADNLS